MSHAEELERSFAATPPDAWDRAMLGVYADALQAAGDPRGELVAIDLQIEASGETARLAERRDEVARQWLGPLAPHFVGSRLGLVELELPAPAALELLATPTARYVCGLVVTGEQADIAGVLVELARRRWPWLVKLGAICANPAGVPCLPKTQHDRLIRATPNLTTLIARGRRVFGRFSHPQVRCLEVVGDEAIALAGNSPVRAAVTHVTFKGFLPNLRAAKLPAATHLDLSRHDGTFYRLSSLELAPQLHALRLPTMTTAEHAASTQELLDRAPRLVELEVTSHHPDTAFALTHPTAKITIGPALPWPTIERVLRIGLAIRLDAATELPVNLVDAVKIMDRNYDRLPVATRDAWDQIWAAFGAFAGPPFELPSALLARALAVVDLGQSDVLQPQWGRLRDALATAPPNVTLRWRFA